MVTQQDKVGKAGTWSQNLALVTKNLALAMYFSHKAAIHTRRICCKGCKTPPSHFQFWNVHEIFSPVGLVLSWCYLSPCKTDQRPFVLECTFIFYHLWHAQRKTLKRLFSFLKRAKGFQACHIILPSEVLSVVKFKCSTPPVLQYSLKTVHVT